jgi:hypothetical protein
MYNCTVVQNARSTRSIIAPNLAAQDVQAQFAALQVYFCCAASYVCSDVLTIRACERWRMKLALKISELLVHINSLNWSIRSTSAPRFAGSNQSRTHQWSQRGCRRWWMPCSSARGAAREVAAAVQGKPALGAGGRRGHCRRRPTSRHHKATENRPPLQPLRRSSSFVGLDATAAGAGSSSICPDAASIRSARVHQGNAKK